MECVTTDNQGLSDRPNLSALSIQNRPARPSSRRRDERLMSDILETCEAALCAVDQDRTIQFSNPAFQKLSRQCPSLANASRVAGLNKPESLALKQAILKTLDHQSPRTVYMPLTDGHNGMSVLIAPLPNAPLALLTVIPLQSGKIDKSQLQQFLRTKWSLSRREAECAILLSQGKPAKRIAEERGVSLPTIRTQLQAIREKLGVESSLEAAAMISRIVQPQTSQPKS